ncbi:MAG: hypothetical protein ACUVXB_06290 [Bryobacteraceae bacterium]
MKLAGRARLEFEALLDASGTILRQTAIFDAVGLTALAYWWLVHPLYALVFGGMLRRIAREAMSQSSAPSLCRDPLPVCCAYRARNQGMTYPVHRMRRLRASESLRSLVREIHLDPSQFILPLFVCPAEVDIISCTN